MTDSKILPPVPCSFVGVNGNAFALMGHWQACAKQAGWPEEEIGRVLKEATNGNYVHLLEVLLANSVDDSDSAATENEVAHVVVVIVNAQIF